MEHETRTWLTERRIEKDITQEELARIVGASRTHITQIEAGGKRPSVDLAIRIGEALDFNWVLFFN